MVLCGAAMLEDWSGESAAEEVYCSHSHPVSVESLAWQDAVPAAKICRNHGAALLQRLLPARKVPGTAESHRQGQCLNPHSLFIGLVLPPRFSTFSVSFCGAN